jgi:hypothetical protein
MHFVIRRADDPDEMMTTALAKARRLVSDLEKEAAELEAKPPDLPFPKLAEGKQAMQNAVASARRMLKALEEAAAMQPDDQEDS